MGSLDEVSLSIGELKAIAKNVSQGMDSMWRAMSGVREDISHIKGKIDKISNLDERIRKLETKQTGYDTISNKAAGAFAVIVVLLSLVGGAFGSSVKAIAGAIFK